MKSESHSYLIVKNGIFAIASMATTAISKQDLLKPLLLAAELLGIDSYPTMDVFTYDHCGACAPSDFAGRSQFRADRIIKHWQDSDYTIA
jgi:hypothetical protein